MTNKQRIYINTETKSLEIKLKLAEQVLVTHKRKLAYDADKDQVRRQIEATHERIRELKLKLAEVQLRKTDQS